MLELPVPEEIDKRKGSMDLFLKKESRYELIREYQKAENSRIQGKAPERTFPHYFYGKPDGEKRDNTGA